MIGTKRRPMALACVLIALPFLLTAQTLWGAPEPPNFDVYYNKTVISEGDVLDYGTIDPGEVITKSFEIINYGPGDLVLPDSIRIEGTDFQLGPSQPTLIAPRSAEKFEIKTTGKGLGVDTHTVTLFFSRGVPPLSFKVKRRISNRIKLFRGGKQLGFGDVVNFDRIADGEVVAKSFKLKNNGSTDIRLGGAIAIEGNEFEVQGSPAAIVPAGEARWFALRTTGMESGIASREVTIDYADDAAAPFSFKLMQTSGATVLRPDPSGAQGLWRVYLVDLNTEAESLQGTFQESGGSRLTLMSEAFDNEDGPPIELGYDRFVGTYTDLSGESEHWVTGVLTFNIEGDAPIYLLDAGSPEDPAKSINDTASLKTIQGDFPFSMFEPPDTPSPNAATWSNLPEWAELEKGGMSQPPILNYACTEIDLTATDSCTYTYCTETQQIVDDWNASLGSCAFSSSLTVFACITTFGPPPINYWGALRCLLGILEQIRCAGTVYTELSRLIAEQELLLEQAYCCYCANFGEYQHMCASCEGLPLRAQVQGLLPGETVPVKGQCLGGQIPLNKTVTFEWGDEQLQDVIVCPLGGDWEVFVPGTVATPGVPVGRNCSPIQGYHGTLPQTSTTSPPASIFDCSCNEDDGECPRISLSGTATGIPLGETVNLVANVVHSDHPDFLAAVEVGHNGIFHFDKTAFPGAQIAYVSETSRSGCTVTGQNLGVPLIHGQVTIKIAEIVCGAEPPDPPDGSYYVTGTAYFGDAGGGPPRGSAEAVLNQEQFIAIEAPVTEFYFPQPLLDGSSYNVTTTSVSNPLTCRVQNPTGSIDGADAYVSIFCRAEDLCVLLPWLCQVENPRCHAEYSYDTAVVWTTDGSGEIFSQHTTFYEIINLICEDPPLTTTPTKAQTVTTGPILYLRNDFEQPMSGQFYLRGVARDDEEGVQPVDVYIDGAPVPGLQLSSNLPDAYTCEEIPSANCDGNSRFSGWIDISNLADGPHQLVVSARNNAQEEVGAAVETTFWVTGGNPGTCQSGDTTGPLVSLTAPADGSTLPPGTVPVHANASDPSGVDTVEFLIDGISHHTDTSLPYSYGWNVQGGVHTLQARAVDRCGNESMSETVTVTIEGTGTCSGDITGPSVSIITLSHGDTIPPGPVTIEVNAIDSNGIESVQFYIDDVLEHIDFSAPYRFVWNATPGVHTIRVAAIDQCGNTAWSDPISVTVEEDPCAGDNTGPAVAMTSPADGDFLPEGFNLLTASASDADGVQRVEFLVNGSLVSTDTTAPYQYNWNAPVGGFFLQAKAYDSCGNPRVSQAVNVTVTGNPCDDDTTGPTITMTSPANGSSHPEGWVNLSADASDPNGVESVQFYANGSLVGVDFSEPWSKNWDATPGTYTLTAGGIDLCGNERLSPPISVTITPVDPCTGDTSGPSVNLTAPADGATLPIGFNMMSATASDTNGVDRVEFYVDGTRVSTDTASPYNHNWNAPLGSFVLQARAFDSCGNARWSNSASVTVESDNPCDTDTTGPTITMTAPADGSTHEEGWVNLSANANDPNGVESVQFYVNGNLEATDFAAPWSKNWNASSGTYSLHAGGIDNCGNEGFSPSITVTITEPDPCAGDTSGPTVSITEPGHNTQHEPGDVTIVVASNDPGGVQRVEFYADGALIHTDTTAPYSYFWWNGTIGEHTLQARAYDNCGFNRWSQQITVDLRRPDEPPVP